MRRIAILLIVIAAAQSNGAQNGPCVVPGRGFFRIHVGTSGLFGMFAHDHHIEVQKIEGCAKLDTRDLTHSSIQLTFPAAGVRVMDPDASAKDRATVQQNMEKDVLNISEFPRIVFESTSIEMSGAPNQLKIHGKLTVRNTTQPVVIPVTFAPLGDGTYQATGKYNFKQSAFGIKPIQLAGGTVKVKDELQSEFELYFR